MKIVELLKSFSWDLFKSDDEDMPLPGRRPAKKAKRHSTGAGGSSAKRKPEIDPSDDSAEVDIRNVKEDPDDCREVHYYLFER